MKEIGFFYDITSSLRQVGERFLGLLQNHSTNGESYEKKGEAY